jgi:hypothetical protein
MDQSKVDTHQRHIEKPFGTVTYILMIKDRTVK